MSAPIVRLELEGPLGVLTLAWADASNAMTPDFIEDFAAAVDEARSQRPRALLVRSEGPNFCVGADLRHFRDCLDEIEDELETMAHGFHDALARLAELPCPVVAQVQGAAVGAGLGLMLAADYVVASDDMRLSTGYVKLGLSAGAGVSFFLTQALGVRRARALLMCARFVGAEEALALGLIDELCPTSEVPARARAAAQRFAKGPTGAYAAMKRLTTMAAADPDLRSHLDRETDEILPLSRSPGLSEAIRSLLANARP